MNFTWKNDCSHLHTHVLFYDNEEAQLAPSPLKSKHKMINGNAKL
jgi:hypothetical protein